MSEGEGVERNDPVARSEQQVLERHPERFADGAQNFRRRFLLAPFDLGEVLLRHPDLCGYVVESSVLIASNLPQHSSVGFTSSDSPLTRTSLRGASIGRVFQPTGTDTTGFAEG